jgi:tetratricopeptide (TPR) repeat protein
MRMWAGQHDVAIEHCETALRLSPRERVGAPFTAIGAAHFYTHRFDEAVPKLLIAIQELPRGAASYRVLAACYAHMGRLDEARGVIARLRVFNSAVMSDASFVRRPAEDRELLLSGVRLALGEAV